MIRDLLSPLSTSGSAGQTPAANTEGNSNVLLSSGKNLFKSFFTALHQGEGQQEDMPQPGDKQSGGESGLQQSGEQEDTLLKNKAKESARELKTASQTAQKGKNILTIQPVRINESDTNAEGGDTETVASGSSEEETKLKAAKTAEGVVTTSPGVQGGSQETITENSKAENTDSAEPEETARIKSEGTGTESGEMKSDQQAGYSAEDITAELKKSGAAEPEKKNIKAPDTTGADTIKPAEKENTETGKTGKPALHISKADKAGAAEIKPADQNNEEQQVINTDSVLNAASAIKKESDTTPAVQPENVNIKGQNDGAGDALVTQGAESESGLNDEKLTAETKAPVRTESRESVKTEPVIVQNKYNTGRKSEQVLSAADNISTATSGESDRAGSSDKNTEINRTQFPGPESKTEEGDATSPSVNKAPVRATEPAFTSDNFAGNIPKSAEASGSELPAGETLSWNRSAGRIQANELQPGSSFSGDIPSQNGSKIITEETAVPAAGKEINSSINVAVAEQDGEQEQGSPSLTGNRDGFSENGKTTEFSKAAQSTELFERIRQLKQQMQQDQPDELINSGNLRPENTVSESANITRPDTSAKFTPVMQQAGSVFKENILKETSFDNKPVTVPAESGEENSENRNLSGTEQRIPVSTMTGRSDRDPLHGLFSPLASTVSDSKEFNPEGADFPDIEGVSMKMTEQADTEQNEQIPGELFKLGEVTLNNTFLRRKVLPVLTTNASRVVQKQIESGSSTWQKHSFEFENGESIQLSTRNVDGVIQIKLASSSAELQQLMQQYSQEIKSHLEQEMETGVDLQFDQQNQSAGSFREQTEGAVNGAQGRGAGEKAGTAKGEEGRNAGSTMSVRSFGYNQNEWTA